MTGDRVAHLAGGTICVGGAVGAGFTRTRIGIADLASGASDATVQTSWRFHTHHGVIADFAFSTI